jgi:hypothetical protein
MSLALASLFPGRAMRQEELAETADLFDRRFVIEFRIKEQGEIGGHLMGVPMTGRVMAVCRTGLTGDVMGAA